MRQKLVVVVLFCTWSGILAQAQTTGDKSSDEHKSYTAPQAYADRSAPPDDAMNGNWSSSKKKRAKHHKQNDHMKHNSDKPAKDAPQNRVEYGGAGL